MILKHLQTVGSITPGQALEEYGVFRLAARIKDLKNMGVKITSEKIARKNRFGKVVRFTRYKYEQ